METGERAEKSRTWLVALIGCGVMGMICLGTIGVILVSGDLLGGLLGGAPEDISTSVRVPAFVEQGEPFVIRFELESAGDETRTLDSIDIEAGYLDGFAVQFSEPAYTDSYTFKALGDEWASYSYNETISPGGRLSVEMTAVGLTPGEYTGQVDVCIDSGARCVSHTATTVVR